MKLTINNPLAVNEDDTMGSAVVKKLTTGYIKGTLAAGVGLGALALVVRAISKKDTSKKKKDDKKSKKKAEVKVS